MKKFFYAAFFLIFFASGALAETTQQPGGNIDTALVGVWGYGINTTSTYYSYYSGDLISANGTAEIIEFLNDGAFTAFRILIGGTGGKKVFLKFHSGNYRVENDIIYLTNVMAKKQYYLNNVLNTDPKETYDWKPAPNQRLKYEFADEDYLKPYYDSDPLRLTNLDGGVYDDGYISFLKYLSPVK
ncbi:MAG: hypothetical protein FWG09_01975 [Synergistaceae bacterium]|nr:hypothetical protein [Synergistaceae bacterium]